MDKFEIIKFFEEHNFVVKDISQNPEEIALEIRTCPGAGEDLSETIYCNNCEEMKIPNQVFIKEKQTYGCC